MPYSAAKRRPTPLRRTWLFCAGADAAAQGAALEAAPDVLMPDLEDFTPPALRPRAREMILALLEKCRKAGVVGAVRVNPLATEGRNDLAVVMQARPAAVLLPKTTAPEQIVELDRAIADHERRLTIPTGSTEIVPNIETAAGLVATAAIAKASTRVKACLVAAEDMAADLCRRGMTVLLPHFRGCWGSGGRFSIPGLFQDARAALELLSRYHQVDPGRVGLLGYSVGGWVALRLAAEFPVAAAARRAPSGRPGRGSLSSPQFQGASLPPSRADPGGIPGRGPGRSSRFLFEAHRPGPRPVRAGTAGPSGPAGVHRRPPRLGPGAQAPFGISGRGP